jgi:hypothetical protein
MMIGRLLLILWAVGSLAAAAAPPPFTVGETR